MSSRKLQQSKSSPEEVHQEVVLFTRAQAYLELLAEGLEPDSLLVHGWEDFLETYGPFIDGVAKRSGLPPDDVRDCTQDVWLAVCASIRHFRHDCQRPRVRGWLGQIVHSKLADIIRHRGRHPVFSLDDSALVAREPTVEDPDPYAEEQREWCDKMVHTVLAELRQHNPESYEILHMRWLEGRNVKDIAALTGLSPEVIWQRQHRAQERFRKLWLQHASNPFDASH